MPDKLIRNVGPYLLGAGIALTVLVIGVTIEIYFPNLASFLGRNLRWLHLAYYSTLVFGLLLWWFWDRHNSLAFWGFVALALVGHTLLFFLYINYVGRLSSIHFMIIGPVEVGLIGLFIDRGMHFAHRRH